VAADLFFAGADEALDGVAVAGGGGGARSATVIDQERNAFGNDPFEGGFDGRRGLGLQMRSDGRMR